MVPVQLDINRLNYFHCARVWFSSLGIVYEDMPPTAEVVLQLLEHGPLTVHEMADLTGQSTDELEETLEYLEPFGVVEYRQGYWIVAGGSSDSSLVYRADVVHE